MKIEPPNKILEDILLVEQTLLGNQTAFEKLVIKYRHKIFDLVVHCKINYDKLRL